MLSSPGPTFYSPAKPSALVYVSVFALLSLCFLEFLHLSLAHLHFILICFSSATFEAQIRGLLLEPQAEFITSSFIQNLHLVLIFIVAVYYNGYVCVTSSLTRPCSL